MRQAKTKSRLNRVGVFDIVIYVIVIITMAITLYPFLNAIAISMSSERAFIVNPYMIFPRDLFWGGYDAILKNPLLYSSYINTIIVAAAGTAIGMTITLLTAFVLSRREFKLRKALSIYMITTMYFSGGMIPMFITIRNLGLYDTLWALILPSCVSVYNTILMTNFLKTDTLYTLQESATVDGASDPRILVHIIIPVSMPSIATIALFYMVGHWNSYFNALLYTRSQKLWTLQLLLREIVLADNVNLNPTVDLINQVTVMNIKTASLVVAILPILCVYPFLQKYFVKGVMMGAVKG